jgi:molybdopterin molybdotransferase
VVLQNLQGDWVAEPVFYKSNLIFTLVRADGLVCIPAPDNGLAAGTTVEVRLI